MIPTAAYLTGVDKESKSLHVLERVLYTSPFQPPGLLWYYSQREGAPENRPYAER
jgi:hypothetical protein